MTSSLRSRVTSRSRGLAAAAAPLAAKESQHEAEGVSMLKTVSNRVWRKALSQWHICVKKSSVHCGFGIRRAVPYLHLQTVSFSFSPAYWKGFKSKRNIYDILQTMPKMVRMRRLFLILIVTFISCLIGFSCQLRLGAIFIVRQSCGMEGEA